MNALGADLVPDPTTAGDFRRRFTEADVVASMDAVNSVRTKLCRGRGRDLLGPVAYLDVDGSIVPTTGSHKQGGLCGLASLDSGKMAPRCLHELHDHNSVGR